jgi:hypothetical protein
MKHLRNLSSSTYWKRKKNALLEQPRPNICNTGIHHRLEPYSGPKEFQVFNPAALASYTGRGAAPVGFTVRRDERLHLPYGAFRVLWRDVEVGRSLSYPEYETCARLRAVHRINARRFGGHTELEEQETTS